MSSQQQNHPTTLAQHLELESARWAATSAAGAAPNADSSSCASSSSSSAASRSAAPLFSPALSRRSSITSDEPLFDVMPLHHHHHHHHHQAAGAAPPHGQQTDGPGGAGPHDPIPVYASLDEAIERSMAALEGLPLRRLVTPGKLYENEEEDDEIFEGGEDAGAAPTG